ncbi:RES domain-containing protein [Patulibacter sp. NPDC049589]|uniref:RES domain-containing protein n=1 Tax=Patulibacter sp. NPDC049589 TaxID=3154731 RepID=UPI00342BF5F9
MAEPDVAIPTGRLHRLARRPDPWAWPDWAFAGPDGTFGNRYDDPQSEYRVLYAGSDRLTCFLETLARFRPDPHVLAVEIAPDPRDGDFPTAPAGQVPVTWVDGRAIGTIEVTWPFTDVGTRAALAHLRDALPDLIVRHGLDDLDGAIELFGLALA